MGKSIKNTFRNIFGKNDLKENSNEPITDASFEMAIAATGFGKFNLILIAIAIPSGWASMFDSSSMSLVTPVAHCDLHMNLQQRGLINAITYVGMIVSAFMWGFLADTLGRKKIIVFGYLTDAMFVIVSGLAQSYEMLLTAKFFNGFIINGPFAALTSVVSEFHAAKYRTIVLLYLGIIYTIAQMVVPALAWLVIPNNMEYEFLDGNFKLHSWNFFLLITAIPSILSFIAHCFLPESPKFLMMVGRNTEAMKTFKKIYSCNTGKDPETFPIKSLTDESKLNQGGKHGGLVTANRSKVKAITEGFQQIQPLFFPPYGFNLLLVSIIQGGFMMGANTIRLWLPQIFTAMNDYQLQYPNVTASLCTMLEVFTPNENATVTECVVNTAADFVYINTLIVSGVAIIVYTCIGSLINKFGKKPTMLVSSFISGVAVVCLYFAQNSATTVALATINSAFISVCLNIVISITVELFPTSLRTVAVASLLMVGRSGSMTGNVIFPFMLELGCLPPFILVGSVVIICSLLSLLLPKTDMKALV